MKKFVIGAVAALATGLGAFAASAQDQQFVSIGTGGVTGVYYPTGGAICRLVASGHGPAAWGYGWSFFLTALEVLSQADRDEMLSRATAARVGQHADRQAWSRFLRSIEPPKPKKPGQIKQTRQDLIGRFGAQVHKQGR